MFNCNGPTRTLDGKDHPEWHCGNPGSYLINGTSYCKTHAQRFAEEKFIDEISDLLEERMRNDFSKYR